MKETENKHHDLKVIAGPCSVDLENLAELYKMSEIQVLNGQGKTQRALSAIRCVGLKSRTKHNSTGEGMGIDFPVIEQIIISEPSEKIPPSVLLAEQFVKETGMGIAAEIMLPSIQLPFYEERIPKGQFMPWNPSNNQLGWSMREMAHIASRNNWPVGVKNGKWLGEPLEQVTQSDNEIITSMEKAWLGVATFATAANCNINFIHRGVDVPEKGEHRSALVHEVVKRLAKKVPNAGRYFDPSHSLGPKLRDNIVKTTVQTMQMTIGNEFLYTGILIEAGTSTTDTGQHITVNELQIMLEEISKFRKLGGPLLLTE